MPFRCADYSSTGGSIRAYILAECKFAIALGCGSPFRTEVCEFLAYLAVQWQHPIFFTVGYNVLIYFMHLIFDF